MRVFNIYAILAKMRIKELTDKDIPEAVLEIVLSEIIDRMERYDYDEKMGRNI